MPAQATQGRICDLLHGRLLSTLLAGDDHVGLEQYSLQFNALLKESIKHGVKNNTRDALTAVYRMRSVHEHFRLDDRNEFLLLTKRGVPSQRVRIHTHAGNTR